MTMPDSGSNTLIEQRYATTTGDIPFESLLAEYGVADNDESLAELIEADGRARIVVHRDVDLKRYLDAVPDLPSRTVPLDAAIDIALRGLSGGPLPSPEAVRLLQTRFPDLAASIAEAASLAQAIWSTTGLRKRVAGPKRQVPSDFGPRMPSGQARYELRRELGSGGWGEVYLAVDRHLSEKGHEALVAIKLLTGPNRGPWARQRLIEEATKARRVDHPNVARVLDRGVSDQDEDYLVYQFVPGGDLGQWLERQNHWPSPRKAAELVARIAHGVNAAHAAGIVHCDLKPGNVLMSDQGEPLVADFGIAVRAGEKIEDLLGGVNGRPVGNLAFISPEQFRREPESLSAASDVYALGGLLYYLVARQLPNGQTVEEITKNHSGAGARARPPSFAARLSWIDQDLAVIAERAMAPEPSARYSSAAAFAEDLERWLRWEDIGWHRPSATRAIALWSRRRPALAASALLTVLVALGGVCGTAYFAGKAADVTRRLTESRRTVSIAAQAITGVKSLLDKTDTQGLLQDAMPVHLLIEWVSGSVVIGAPEDVQDQWKRRVEVLKSYIANRREAGLGDSIEVLIWETTQGLYTVRAGDYEKAEPLLRSNLSAWKSRLTGGDDPFLRLIEHLIAVARVQGLAAAVAAGTVTPDQRIEMGALAAQLRPLLSLDAPHLEGAPVHLLAMSAYRDLCGPAMLDRPEDLAKAKNILDLATQPRFKGHMRP